MRDAGCGMRVSGDQLMPVEAKRVADDDHELFRISHPASRIPHPGGQPAIPFDGNDVTHARGEDGRQAPRPGPDLDHDVVGGGLERVGDALQDVPVGEKVLAEPFVRNHTLRITTVRSSAGGAPPVKPARSACTDSRISRAGRSFKRATWPSTRSSPKRSALPPPPPPPPPPSASATPSVKRQTIASRRAQVSTASAPGAVARPS